MGRVVKNIYHKKQVAGEERISVTYASEHEAEFLEVLSETPLFFTSGIIEDEEGIVVMYYKQLLRGDKFKFVSRIDNEQS